MLRFRQIDPLLHIIIIDCPYYCGVMVFSVECDAEGCMLKRRGAVIFFCNINDHFYSFCSNITIFTSILCHAMSTLPFFKQLNIVKRSRVRNIKNSFK